MVLILFGVFFFCHLLGDLIVPTFSFRAAVSVHRGPVFADPFARRSHAGAEEVVLVVSGRWGTQAREVRLYSGRVRWWTGRERSTRTRRFLIVPLCARLLAWCPRRALLFLTAFEISDLFVRALDSRTGLLAHCHPNKIHKTTNKQKKSRRFVDVLRLTKIEELT